MQIDKAIEGLKNDVYGLKNFLTDTEKELWQEAIETVLKELEEQTNSNKELNKVLIHFKAVINEMVEQLVKLREEGQEDCFIPRKFCNIDECVQRECIECIKQYFSEKVSE